jgi:hypothetical protein
MNSGEEENVFVVGDEPWLGRLNRKHYVSKNIGADYITSIKVLCPVENDCDMRSPTNHDARFSLTNKYTTPYCTKVEQTVTSAGQNKFWSSRVYEGSDYELACNAGLLLAQTNTCNYTTDYFPFGSIYPPAPDTNPYEWDSKGDSGIQPLYYEPAKKDNPRMGQLNSINNLSRIFAQSYGTWLWTDKECKGGSKDGFACDVDPNCHGNCKKYCVSANPAIEGGACNSADNCITYVDSLGKAECNLGTGCDSGCKFEEICNTDEDCRSGYCNLDILTCNGGINHGFGCADDSDCEIPNCFSCNEGARRCAENPSIDCTDNPDICNGYCSEGDDRYIQSDALGWRPPTNFCPGVDGNGRRPVFNPDANPATGQCDPDGDGPISPGSCYACPSATCDLCSVLPKITNLEVNNTATSTAISKTQIVSLTFNSEVDGQQLPMVMYAVDWGDNETTVVSGIEMRGMPNEYDPHTLYHLYSYWELLAKHSIDQREDDKNNTVYCGDDGEETCNYEDLNSVGDPCGSGTGYVCSGSDCCVIKPKVKIKDNWGWCNAGSRTLGGDVENPGELNECDLWAEFNSWIVVTER